MDEGRAVAVDAAREDWVEVDGVRVEGEGGEVEEVGGCRGEGAREGRGVRVCDGESVRCAACGEGGGIRTLYETR